MTLGPFFCFDKKLEISRDVLGKIRKPFYHLSDYLSSFKRIFFQAESHSLSNLCVFFQTIFFFVYNRKLKKKALNQKFRGIFFVFNFQLFVVNLTENFWRGNFFFTLERSQLKLFFLIIVHQDRRISDFPNLKFCKFLHFFLFLGAHKIFSKYDKIKVRAEIVFIKSKLKAYQKKCFFVFFFLYFFCFEHQQNFWRKKKKSRKIWNDKVFLFLVSLCRKTFFFLNLSSIRCFFSVFNFKTYILSIFHMVENLIHSRRNFCDLSRWVI